MKENRVNISNYGHYNPLTLLEFINYFKVIFKKFKIDLSVSNSFNKKKINIVFEGHHPLFRKKFTEIIKESSNIKNGIVLTEVIYGSNFLNTKYFTFNNRVLNKNINNTIFSFIYLIYLNLTYFFVQLLKKYLWNLYQRIKYLQERKEKYLILFLLKKVLSFFFDELDNANGIYYWKERYNFFHSIIKSFDFIIIFGNDTEYHNKFQNNFKINYLSTGIKINKKKISKSKKIDCLFTGQLTSHRKKLLNSLIKEGVKVKYYDYLENKKRREVQDNTKIYLCLNKFKDDNLTLGTRAWHCLENSIFFVTEKNNVKNKFLEKFCIEIENSNTSNQFPGEIKKILKNYKYYQNIFLKKLQSYRKLPFYKSKEIIKFINYLNK
jgi:hypothetical protein